MTKIDVHQSSQVTTAMTAPLQLLSKALCQHQQAIEAWFQSQWKKSPPPIYGSVDLRNAGFKLAPVDMNLFPAGFNNLNLNPNFVTASQQAAKLAIEQISDKIKNILLIPENHTRNLFYWESVYALLQTLKQAGYTVRIGSLLPDLTATQTITLANGELIQLEVIKKVHGRIVLDDFVPDFILLNNDLSDGIPEILQNVAQPISPPPSLGWSHRLKSEHFRYYAEVCEEFAKLIQIDPWIIAPLFLHCGEIDFMRREGEACLVSHVESLLNALKQKYAEYEIPHAPYVVVKADAGTYGMVVMMVKSVDEVHMLNRKQRTHMAKSKGGQPVRRVIVQEGVYTFETVGADKAVAEPVVYLWGERAVGGFYRVHKERGVDENLNSPGMHFEPLVFDKSCDQPEHCFYAHGVIARLSMLAAAREITGGQNK